MARKKTASKAARRTGARRTSAGAKRAAAGTTRKSRTTGKAKATSKTKTPRTARTKTAARAAATRARRQSPEPKAPTVIQRVAARVRGTIAGVAAAVPITLPWKDSSPDAIQVLEGEHRRFEELIRQGEDTTTRARKTRRELLDTLQKALVAHELMEEKVLYPALRSHAEARAMVLEGYEEHHVADVIVGELQGVAEDDEQWAAKFKVLKENLEHHIQEEEGQMFPVARSIFSREELQTLAAEMRAVRPATA